LIDIEKVRETMKNKTAKIRDVTEKLVESKVCAYWIVSGSAEQQQISQTLTTRKFTHVFLTYSSTATLSETVNMLQGKIWREDCRQWRMQLTLLSDVKRCDY
jgi:hypothetical protein